MKLVVTGMCGVWRRTMSRSAVKHSRSMSEVKRRKSRTWAGFFR
ncbi:hypothetical protein STENM327S_01277 [Streptomyces tendae]